VLVEEVSGHPRGNSIGVAGLERGEVCTHGLATRVHLRDGTGHPMWSNDAVADDPDDPDDPDEASPWTRDDWLPDSAVPDENVLGIGPRATVGGPSTAEPPPEDFDVPDSDARTSGSSTVRRVVAAGVVIALLVGSAAALLRDDEVPEAVPDSDADPADVVTSVPATVSPDTIPPTDSVVVDVPTSSEPGEPGDLLQAAGVSPIVVGELPAWTERTIPIAEPLAAMASTEVVTLSRTGIVSVTEFPSGRTRSVDVSAVGADLQLAFGDGSIVVFDSTTLLQIREGEPVVESELGDGIIFVQSWTGTGNFIVTTPATGARAPEQDWVLRPDGSLELLDNRFAVETSFFSRVFSPFGDALVTAPGGVYAVDAAGAARRISTGTLLATGSRHWAIEECDEVLRCAYSIIEWDTGAVTSGALDSIDGFGLLDPSTRISPDGRSIAYRGDTDGSGRRLILDTATGASVLAGRINQVVYPDSWASDSSGLFFADGFLQFVDRTTGTVTQIEDLDRIRAVATGTFST
jgi:hypothetical protein